MTEGLSPSDVGKEIEHHAKALASREERDRLLSISEAVLLSVVALIAAWSGYSAAKWSTESRRHFADASTLRTKASRANLEALELRNFDASTFNAWFAAYTARNEQAMALAERRFRPAFRAAFDAWRATKPETNPNAPRGPTYVAQYKQPALARARQLDRRADEAYAEGAEAGDTADDYVRTTFLRPSSSWSGSARISHCAAFGTRSSLSEGCCSSSRSSSSRSCHGCESLSECCSRLGGRFLDLFLFPLSCGRDDDGAEERDAEPADRDNRMPGRILL
jgi:hypothetical protein